MKKVRIISLVAVLAMVFTIFGCTAFATEASTTSAAVSGSDVSGSDVVSASDFISEYALIDFEVKSHRLSMLVPNIEKVFSANSSNADIAKMLPNYTVENIINYNDSYYSGNIISYLYSATTNSGDVMMNVLYTSNNYTKFIGDYSDVDEAVVKDIIYSTFNYSGKMPEEKVINGNIFLYDEGLDSETGKYCYSLETIVGGGRYQIYIDLSNPSTADKDIVADIVDSIKIGGFRASNIGAADKNLVTGLLIAVIVLFVVVCFLTFFIIRFSLYSNAAGSKFNIIGFNMPPSKAELEKLRKKQSAKKGSSKNTKSTSLVDSFDDID